MARCILESGIEGFPWRQCCQCALSSAEASLCRGETGREKRERAADVCARLLFFDYGYQAGTSLDERGECDNRGAEIIWNKRKTLFIQVRIALVARLIITLTLKSEGEISWCYRSNQTSLVKRLHSTTYFLHFTKGNLNFHANFFRPPSGLLGVRGLKF